MEESSFLLFGDGEGKFMKVCNMKRSWISVVLYEEKFLKFYVTLKPLRITTLNSSFSFTDVRKHGKSSI